MLLAELPGAEVRPRYPNGFPRLTDHTITDFAALERELEPVRRRGDAVNRGESDADLTALAVPIHDRIGRVVAALAISSLASRMGPNSSRRWSTLRDDIRPESKPTSADVILFWIAFRSSSEGGGATERAGETG